jgi:hypothetical protein
MIKFDKIQSKVTKYFDSVTIFNLFNDTDIETKENNQTVTFSPTLIQIFRNFQDEIRKEFIEESINYVSPLPVPILHIC